MGIYNDFRGGYFTYFANITLQTLTLHLLITQFLAVFKRGCSGHYDSSAMQYNL